MKRNGFTLIELLAVIVVLAIIALIATPIVLNIINNAKTSSNERSGELYVKAVENAIMKKQMNGTDVVTSGTYTVQSDGSICIVSNNVCSEGTTISVDVEGDVPTEGTITVSNGVVTTYNLVVSGTSVTKGESGDDEEDENEESSIPYSFTLNDLIEHNIISKFTNNSGNSYYLGLNLEEFVTYIGFTSLSEFENSEYNVLKYVSNCNFYIIINSNDENYSVLEIEESDNKFNLYTQYLNETIIYENQLKIDNIGNMNYYIDPQIWWVWSENNKKFTNMYIKYTYEEFLDEYGDTIFYLDSVPQYLE